MFSRVEDSLPPFVANIDEDLVRHQAALFGWALACCRGDRALAEDVLQTAYLKVIDGRARASDSRDFRAFLFGVIRRTASEERRRRAVRAALSLAVLQREPGASAIEHSELRSVIRAETSRELITAVDTLPTRQREVLYLVFYQDLSIAAAAEVMGVSVGSARTHYERGKARLRELLEKGDYDAG